jgi:AcrR family transcriptional regulator
MSSVSNETMPESGSRDDRTARARIRDSAIDVIADVGLAEATVRRIAAAADVSPGLVIHHFGSMDGLRRSCDEHVAATIKHYKDNALSSGPGLDVLGAIRTAEFGSMIGYLAEVLTENSPVVARLVDDMIGDAEEYLEHGVASGILRPTDDPRGRAVILAMWSLGALVLHRHLARHIGIDLTDPDLASAPRFVDYVRPVMELMGSGIYTEDFATEATEALASGAAGSNAET